MYKYNLKLYKININHKILLTINRVNLINIRWANKKIPELCLTVIIVSLILSHLS